jgi:hypothetical protein
MMLLDLKMIVAIRLALLWMLEGLLPLLGEVYLDVCILFGVAGGIKHMGGRCIRPTPEELEDFGTPDFTIYNAGQFPCNRYTHYMSSSTSIDLNLKRKEMVILGTQYAGEMKKGLFSLMHYLMPKRGILSLHSGCNMGKAGDVALFFGLSGIVGERKTRSSRVLGQLQDGKHVGGTNADGRCDVWANVQGPVRRLCRRTRTVS